MDLSTGINPQPFPVPTVSAAAWTALPDKAAVQALNDAARAFWSVPDQADILAAPGASALIAHMPLLLDPARVVIPAPTYNEHAASFRNAGWDVLPGGVGEARVLVHPNNPDGRVWRAEDVGAGLTIIDESFCDICPEQSLIHVADRPGVIVLKSFGKFWGLAGLRLGFAIGAPETLQVLAEMLGPWPVSGPALEIGAAALRDEEWATQTRKRLTEDAARLDEMTIAAGAQLLGGTSLFRLYEVDDAAAWQDRLAQHHIWSRIFPYSQTWLRFGLPPAHGWDRLRVAL